MNQLEFDKSLVCTGYEENSYLIWSNGRKGSTNRFDWFKFKGHRMYFISDEEYYKKELVIYMLLVEYQWLNIYRV